MVISSSSIFKDCFSSDATLRELSDFLAHGGRGGAGGNGGDQVNIID